MASDAQYEVDCVVWCMLRSVRCMLRSVRCILHALCPAAAQRRPSAQLRVVLYVLLQRIMHNLHVDFIKTDQLGCRELWVNCIRREASTGDSKLLIDQSFRQIRRRTVGAGGAKAFIRMAQWIASLLCQRSPVDLGGRHAMRLQLRLRE